MYKLELKYTKITEATVLATPPTQADYRKCFCSAR